MLNVVDHEPEPEEPLEPEAEPEPDRMEAIGDIATRALGDEREVVLATRKRTLIEQADALRVVDAASYEKAADLAKTFAGMVKDAEAHFDPDIAKANALHKSLCAKKNDFLAQLVNALEVLKTRASSWYRTEEQKRENERKRLEVEARQRQEAERIRLEAEARVAAAAGKPERAQELREEAQSVEDAPPPPQPVSTVPKVRGISQRENWTFEVHEKKAFVAAVAGTDRMLAEVEARIAVLRDKKEGTAEDVAVFNALVSLQAALKGVTPTISLEAIEPCDTYLRGRAKTDKNTLKWPGVRFYDKGSVAVRS